MRPVHQSPDLSDAAEADVLLLGCGDLGTAVAQRLTGSGHRVFAIRRDARQLPTWLAGCALDYSDPDQAQLLGRVPARIVLFTPTPVAPDAAGYQQGFVRAVSNVLQAWQRGPQRKLLFVSSTRVYGECGGDWVNEDTPPRLAGYAAEAIYQAEELLRESRHQLCTVRFAGIYGRHPSRLLQRVARGDLCARHPPVFSNRIHRDDCVGFLEHLLRAMLAGEALQPTYVGVDDCPVLQWEMESWLANQLGVKTINEGVARARGGNKRCSNRLLRSSGYQLVYPEYRRGYQQMLATAASAQ